MRGAWLRLTLLAVPAPVPPSVLCFVSEAEAADREVWESGEVGGFEAYLLADDDNEAAEVYKAVSQGQGTVHRPW